MTHSEQMRTRWRVAIDVGGTFSDIVASTPDGSPRRLKILSSATMIGRGSVEYSADECLLVLRDISRTEPDDFWTGYRITVRNALGDANWQGEITSSLSSGEIKAKRVASERPNETNSNAASTSYEIASPEESPLFGLRILTGTPLSVALPPVDLRLGTTKGTNALLTRTGSPTLLVVTRGFRDLLRIGFQDRPSLFSLHIEKPLPLTDEVIEANERIQSDGKVLMTLDVDSLRSELVGAYEKGFRSIAISLLHGNLNNTHEKAIASLSREIGFETIVTSSEVSTRTGYLMRTETSVVDGYLNPVLLDYLDSISSRLSSGSSFSLMTSAGDLVSQAEFTGKDSLLSGPAGGVVGFSTIAARLGFSQAIGFDMGGTSTDVARFAGEFLWEHETKKAGVRVMTPSLAIETIAAGGGSICRFDGRKLTVGPESAGANPGPACYGRGGPLTITDMNLYLGRISIDQFNFPLNRTIVAEKLRQESDLIRTAIGLEYSSQQLAENFLAIANEKMASAVRSISISQGYDPREFALVAFGGAAGQHACQVARALGITKVICHPDAGLLSALGISVARRRYRAEEAVYLPIDSVDDLSIDRLIDSQRAKLAHKPVIAICEVDRMTVETSFELRYQGTSNSLLVPRSPLKSIRELFEAQHRRRFGFTQNRPVELVAVHSIFEVVSEPEAAAANSTIKSIPENSPGQDCEELVGPGVVANPFATFFLDEGWKGNWSADGSLILTDTSLTESPQIASRRTTSPADSSNSEIATCSTPDESFASSHNDSELGILDPAKLEIISNQFTSIASQMGYALQRTAASTNIKERLDFSCAIFTNRGDLVVNAPHIPVHLGAMAETVRATLAANPEMREGDVYVTNDPYQGGSHLPDVTVISPVFCSDKAEPDFIVANRAHHAEIGGISPGSMPPMATRLGEEGVIIRNFLVQTARESRLPLLERGLRGEAIEEACRPHESVTAEFASRNAVENIRDLVAQIAANQQGIDDIKRLCLKLSLSEVSRYATGLQATAKQYLRAVLDRLPFSTASFEDHLDDGTKISVRLTKSAEKLLIDFTGTSPPHPRNFNANPAIVTSAILYVLRVLIEYDRMIQLRDASTRRAAQHHLDVPLNQGLLADIELMIPSSCLNPTAAPNHADSPAVVAGNVETSQRVVDVLLGALGIAGASQGTMNNFLFGNDRFGYYETICGGAGATAFGPGASGVHTHMTNTRITDPEIFERRYPVRLWKFAIRPDRNPCASDGTEFEGGRGIEREFEFLEPLTVTIVSNRRGKYRPYGARGASPGLPGENILTLKSGEVRRLEGTSQLSVNIGDRISLRTPNGGNYRK